MTTQEVQEKIGIDRWEEWIKFMHGQTVGLNDDGSTDWFDQDVDNFLRPKRKRFFD